MRAGPVARLALVALQDADVVQRLVAAGAEKRRPVAVDRAVEPQPVHHERRRGTQPPNAAPATSSSPRSVRRLDDPLQTGDVGGQHDAVGVEVLAGISVHPEGGADRCRPWSRCSTLRCPVRNRTPRAQVVRAADSTGGVEVGVGDVEDQALAGAEEVDVEHGRELGGRQLRRLGEEAAGEHLERQMPCGVGEVDVLQEASRRRCRRAGGRCRGTDTAASGAAARALMRTRSRSRKVGLRKRERAARSTAACGAARGRCRAGRAASTSG